MTDDDLRQSLREAHRADHPPPLHAILSRGRRGSPRRRWLAIPALAAVALAVVLLWPRRPPPPGLALGGAVWTAPTDFLLDLPGGELLRETPRFELKGPIP